MLDTPQITLTTTQATAIIHLVVPREEIQNVMGPSIGELMATIAAQGTAPAGPIFTHHLRRPTDTFDFELSVPVNAQVVPAGRVKPGEWPAMKVARTVLPRTLRRTRRRLGRVDRLDRGEGAQAGPGPI